MELRESVAGGWGLFAGMYRQLLLFRKQQSERVLQEQKNTQEVQLDNQQNIRQMKHDMKG